MVTETHKEVWHLRITDHPGYSLYSKEIVRTKVKEYGDRVTFVGYQVQKWTGSHEDGTRGYSILVDRDDTARWVSTQAGHRAAGNIDPA